MTARRLNPAAIHVCDYVALYASPELRASRLARIQRSDPVAGRYSSGPPRNKKRTAKPGLLPLDAQSSDLVLNCQVLPTGVEQPDKLPGDSRNLRAGGAQGGADQASPGLAHDGLAVVTEKWRRLPDEVVAESVPVDDGQNGLPWHRSRLCRRFATSDDVTKGT